MENIIELLENRQYCFDDIVDDFPMIRELKDIDQNPEWHGEGDVYVHTRNVCNAILSLHEWQFLNQEEKGILYLAGLFHDIGKKKCTCVENGLIVSPKHAKTGARIVQDLFYRDNRYGESLTCGQRNQVAALIRYHGLPQLFMEKPQMDVYLLRARETTSFPLLYLLAKADVLGRECADQEELLAMVNYFKEYTLEIPCFFEPWKFANEFTRNRYFRGVNVSYEDTLFDTTEFTVYMMSGLPLAGKDTYIAECLGDLPEISLDQIRDEWGIAPAKKSSEVVAEAKERAKELLRKKQSFVWNATNILAETRRKLCDMFEAYGGRVEIIYLEVPYRVLLERNKTRERYIPLPALERMIYKLEIPEPAEAYRVTYGSCKSGKE